MNVTKSDNFLLPQLKLNNMVSELQKGLINDMYWLLKESNNHDAIINIGEAPNVKSFKAHTSILSARSLYFRAILSNGYLNKRNSLIEITQSNIQPEVFEVILKFLYTGKISLKNEKDVKYLFDYIIAAEKLWLYQLIQYIENYMIYQLTDWLKSNFVYVLIKTHSNSSSFRLLHEFVNDMLRNHSYLLFDSNHFNIIPENILVQLLQHRRFKDVTEEKIWNTVLNWGINQNIDLLEKDIRNWTPLDYSKLQTSLQRCVPLIRFTNIPPKIFYDLVEPYKEILTQGLYQKIMQNTMFITYNRLMPRSLPLQSLSSSKSSKTSQKRDSFSSIPSPLLQAFPMPPPKEESWLSSKEKSLPPPKEESWSPSKEKSLPPPKEESWPPYKEKSLPSSKEESWSPYKEKSSPPSKEESWSPYKEKSSSPSKEESLSPSKEKSLSPSKEKSLAPYKEKTLDELILFTSKNKSPPKSTVNNIPDTTESPTSISKSTSTATLKSKNSIKRSGSIKKPDELLAKITSSVLSSTYTVRRKPKSSSMTSYPIETLEKSLLSAEENLKRSNTTKKSEFSNFESILELKTLKSFGPEIDASPLTLRKMKRILNRKTSIVSSSSSSSTMSVSTLPR
ncbi:hypothetical protein GLOIN_2v1776507 [Rhizophagus irregularis DAOM 181602=DAOM 197198]|uniref:BTB domain-containing protein n=1 Tax=Rhizophagus irregularis (strain DAOM 181602 / DAOM 197198 / MUCL 43194) TaxID=747089 RepID=A0A2P4PX21_RHIID|nr:hypothetical protein GLOIN_2v1776507 [Rhizophagus irregularis DAOM 181602=DAOM 197198]POG69941.1 hypothetical protein GLOIN_2v1776507 [Rhizophagus irregularis DAOM 181602=DAOM 197198]|eukprot:XP_025176807.1 hypothetical protein GLOIN_2v1776507 [Rhizophagus irregularis DAOM 181602=DAOM 197198]